MTVKSIISVRFLTICISILTAVCMLIADNSFAGERNRRGTAPPAPRHERVVVKQRGRIAAAPRYTGHGKITVERRDRDRSIRTYRERQFPRRVVIRRPVIQRHFPSRRVIVHAPRTVVIRRLPVGFRTIWGGDGWFFYFNGFYYQRVSSGYVVVNAPPKTVVIRDPIEVVEPAESASGMVSVTAVTLNVRAGPGMHHPPVYQVKEGLMLEVCGKDDGWLYVQLPNGEFGWVMDIHTIDVEPASG